MDFTVGLNPMQKEAVLCTEGPLLILAGAGSGKTKVLTHRMAHLVENKGVSPWSILAITFTNKAAAEMKERISLLIGEELTRDMWVSTFHAMCVRILRRYGEAIGYGRYFTIYDTQDQKALIKDVLKELDINEKNFPVSAMLGSISQKKNELITCEEAVKQGTQDYREKVIADIYTAYQKKLRDNNAMDFDDLLMQTYLLLSQNESVLTYYQNKFEYILVDEYQDTNTVQYHLVELLARKHHNLCVVGDDDQSIYGWRGADITNILNFEKDFQNAKVIKLEQNYRSTQNILNAANAVVANNRTRKPKKLWTGNSEGQEITILEMNNEYREADQIATTIIKSVASGEKRYKDFAILYRTNAQSRVLEEKMVQNTIPYRLLGGTRFYERKEIKDLIGYLKVVANSKDDIAVKRVINVPKRGIGQTTINTLTEYALRQNMDFFEAAMQSGPLGILGKGPSQKVQTFTYLIQQFREVAAEGDIQTLLETIIKEIKYTDYLRETEAATAEERIKNIEELVSKTAYYMQNAEDASLEAFLEEVALVADVDNYDEASDSVVLMTLHSAKGLEFPVVFMPGVEEGLFPSYMSMTEGEDKLEEERRLCYVGITRAREKLYILHAMERTVFGKTQYTTASRFIKEIPVEITNLIKAVPNKKTTTKEKRMPKSNILTSALTGSKKKIENLPKVTMQFNKGDKVKHKKFGQGTIMQVEQVEEDIFTTIQFTTGEIKKLSVRFAKLQKIN